ncbi:MAG TPA: hypothetical protein VOA80_05420 [Thermoanaerobaculia bacterium]|nr:hypothetical protein [Thermoanaerobaculia bacterium]
MSLAESYTQEILRELKLYAAWVPGVPLKLGDYGLLEGSTFYPAGNLADLDVSFKPRKDPNEKRVFYLSEGSQQAQIGAGASAQAGPLANAKAALKVSFNRAHAVLFNAAGVTYESMANAGDLQGQLLPLLQRRIWNPRHAVITELTRSGSTTVVISSGSNGGCVLEAEADVPGVDLADVSAKFAIKNQQNIGYGVAAASGMTPLFGLSRLRPSGMFWWRRIELRRQFGFAGKAGDADPESVPPDFRNKLEMNVDALIDLVRGNAAPAEKAFEWIKL